jgi:hypothetical protein
MTKWNRVQSTFHRLHDDLFFEEGYNADFYSYDETYDSANDEWLTTRNSVGTTNVELTPPGINLSVDADGTSNGLDAIARLPEDDSVLTSIETYSDDNEQASELEIQGETYIIQGTRIEEGSGFTMLELVEV